MRRLFVVHDRFGVFEHRRVQSWNMEIGGIKTKNQISIVGSHN